MKIENVFFAQGVASYFFDDQRAIREGAQRDGFLYRGRPATDGFEDVRVPGESLSVGLVSPEGLIAWGDCCAVQYSGAGGRDPVFRAETYLDPLNRQLKPQLIGLEFSSFREACRALGDLRIGDGRPLHTAIRYGITQAFLAACALERRKTMAGVIAEEYSLPLKPKKVSILGQCGECRYDNVDKMILKGADLLPHGLVNSVETFGRAGEVLTEYVGWVRQRVLDVRRSPAYTPDLYFDVYGLPGWAFGGDIPRITAFLGDLCREAEPFSLKIEGPLDAGSRAGQIARMAELKEAVAAAGLPVELVADEWCNTLEDIGRFARADAAHMLQIKTPDLGGLDASVEAVLLCRRRGVKAYLGGTCNETELSAKACTHVALATRPDQMLAKPGMGFDEGYGVVYNEMNRVISLLW